jgi:signal transduction histidine kinase
MVMEPLKGESPAELCDGLVPLEAILCTEELHRRPSRLPDYEAESRALSALTHALANSPRTILQTLAETILKVLGADSAGLSLLSKDEKRFYWAAIAGAWQPHLGGGTPRDSGPCGDVLDCNKPLLFRHWEHRYPYLQGAVPLAEEGLLIPFHVEGKAVGTIWAIAHDDRRKFDGEDLRQLESLGRFASVAYQAYERLRDAESDLRQLSGRLLHLQDEERRRIARHMHETVAQSLAALKMNLAIVEKAKEVLDNRATYALEEIRSLLEVCIREVRTLSYLLHPPLLDESGLPSALRWYTEGFEQRSGVRVNLQIPANLGRLSQEMETTLFRIVQECLTNIHRHSGSSTATIAVRQNAEELVLEVKDEGRGMPPRIINANEPVGVVGVGIAGMRERIKQLGGQMEIQSDSKGTTVKAVLQFIGGAVCQDSGS